MPVDSLCRQITPVAIGIGYSVTVKSNFCCWTSISNKNSESEQKGEGHGYIAYIPILDIVETKDIILSNNICDVQRHGYAC